MANVTVYLKCDRNVESQEEDVFLKDIATLQCTDQQVLAKCKAVKVHHFSEGDQAQGGRSPGSGKKPWTGQAHQQRCVVSVLKIIALMEEACPGITVQSVGETDVVLERVKSAGKTGYGFDAYKEEYVDMIAAGIVDPAKVTRSALENAASVAAMVLTTESLVADKPEPPAPAPAGGGMDMGGMY